MSIYTLGIDIGSTASKCIMLEDGKEIVAKSLIAVGAGTSGPQRAIAARLGVLVHIVVLYLAEVPVVGLYKLTEHVRAAVV